MDAHEYRPFEPLRILGRVVDRIGLFIVVVAGCGGLVVALYALLHGLAMVFDGQLSGMTDALKRMLLLPFVAAMTGGVVAIAGLGLMYLGDALLETEAARTTEPEGEPVASGS